MDKDSSCISDQERTKDTFEKKHDRHFNNEESMNPLVKSPSHKSTVVSNQNNADPLSSVQLEEDAEGKDQSDDYTSTVEDTGEPPKGTNLTKESNDTTTDNSVRRKSSSRKRSKHLSNDDRPERHDSSSSPSENEPPTKVPRHVLMTSKRNPSFEPHLDETGNESSSNDRHGDMDQDLTAIATATNDILKSSESTTAVVSDPSKTVAKIDDDYEIPESDETYLSIINLETIPMSEPLRKLTPREVCQLEAALQIGDVYSEFSDQCTWQDDWNGNLQLLEKDIILNRDELSKDPTTKPIVMPFCEWVAKLARHSEDFLPAELLFSFVYHMKGTPPMAKRILAHYIHRPANSVPERLNLIDGLRRISHDPNVLVEDGWTTLKSDVPDGASGGTYLIGRRVIWQS